MAKKRKKEPCILIIDACRVTREETYEMLESEWSDEIVTAENAKEGIELFIKFAHNLKAVIIDLNLPDMTLATVLKKIKSENVTPEIIVLTNENDIPAAVQAMKLGVYDILKRPVFKAELLFSIGKVFELDHIIEKLKSYLEDNKELVLEIRLEEFRKIMQERRRIGNPLTHREIALFFPPPGERSNVSLDDIYREFASRENVDFEDDLPFTILIVEDDPDMRRNLFELLLGKGFNVLQAEDARSALEIVKNEEVIDLAVLDIGLPDETGDRLIGKIKSINNNIEFIVLTSYQDIELVVSTMKSGASDYVTKPYRSALLYSKVADVLMRKHFKGLIPKYWKDSVRDKLI
jgi:DNA-binding NtrC family response regulator